MLKYLFLILLTVPTAQAQQNLDSPDGLVVYRQKINMSSPAIKLDTLRYNRTKSIFEWNLYPTSSEEVRKAKEKYPTARVVKPINGIGAESQITLFDSEKDSIFSRMSMVFLDKLLYLKEKAPKINWTISDSTKMVGNYTTQKATAYFRGREYTAWFTSEIPVPFGPWKLYGLPGLILQAYDQSGNIHFSAVNIALTDVGLIESIPLSGKEEIITLAEYKKLMDSFKRHMKSAVLKKVRPYVSKEDFANMKVELPKVELMETFNANGDQ